MYLGPLRRELLCLGSAWYCTLQHNTQGRRKHNLKNPDFSTFFSASLLYQSRGSEHAAAQCPEYAGCTGRGTEPPSGYFGVNHESGVDTHRTCTATQVSWTGECRRNTSVPWGRLLRGESDAPVAAGAKAQCVLSNKAFSPSSVTDLTPFPP